MKSPGERKPWRYPVVLGQRERYSIRTPVPPKRTGTLVALGMLLAWAFFCGLILGLAL